MLRPSGLLYHEPKEYILAEHIRRDMVRELTGSNVGLWAIYCQQILLDIILLRLTCCHIDDSSKFAMGEMLKRMRRGYGPPVYLCGENPALRMTSLGILPASLQHGLFL